MIGLDRPRVGGNVGLWPVTEENVDRATAGPDISEEEHEVVLHEEEPIVEKRAVPKERVRVAKDTVTEEEQVNGEVRKEQIEELRRHTPVIPKN